MSEPWAFIGHKDGYWAALASAQMPKKALGEALADMAADGLTITTVHSRDEYNAVLATMKYWGERPEPLGPQFQGDGA